MSKEEQMIEYMVQDLVEILSETSGMEYDSAMKIIYDSEVLFKSKYSF